MPQADADARNAIQKVVEKWIDDATNKTEQACTAVAADAIVEGVAEAVAKAFATVANTVRGRLKLSREPSCGIFNALKGASTHARSWEGDSSVE